MSIYTDDNPPAFPRTYSHEGHNGLSMRDYFAGQALAGLMQNPGLPAVVNSGDVSRFENALNAIARVAGAAADTMLAERAK